MPGHGAVRQRPVFQPKRRTGLDLIHILRQDGDLDLQLHGLQEAMHQRLHLRELERAQHRR